LSSICQGKSIILTLIKAPCYRGHDT